MGQENNKKKLLLYLPSTCLCATHPSWSSTLPSQYCCSSRHRQNPCLLSRRPLLFLTMWNSDLCFLKKIGPNVWTRRIDYEVRRHLLCRRELQVRFCPCLERTCSQCLVLCDAVDTSMLLFFFFFLLWQLFSLGVKECRCDGVVV